ncbi:MAG: hypothetical protein QF473_28540 [Planctomycetota bacterium]|jgi:hypothetical protein|nr:hypothetical protein [Planctomycetota bacterium]
MSQPGFLTGEDVAVRWQPNAPELGRCRCKVSDSGEFSYSWQPNSPEAGGKAFAGNRGKERRAELKHGG